MAESGVTVVDRLARSIRAERRYALGWAVIVVGIALRVGWAAWVAHTHPHAVTSGDTPGYLGPARALIENGHFSVSPHDDTPMFLRTPGYPALLAAILWVTNSVWAISPIQAALTLGTVVLVVVIGRRVISPAAGLLAGVLVVLDPLQFALSGTILTESLATFMLVAVVAAGIPVFATGREHVRARALAVLGALIAMATLVRPTTYYFPALVLVLLAVRFIRLPKRSLLALMLAFVVPVVVVTGAWSLRNHDAVDSWQISGSQSVTLYCWHAAAVDAQVRGVSITTSRQRLGCNPGGWDNLEDVCPSWWACDARRPLADGPSWDEMGDRATEILERHPVEAAEQMVRGLAREIAGPGTDTVRRFLHVRSSPPLVAALFLWNALLWSLALVGAYAAWRSTRRWFWGFVISIVTYVVLLSGGANSSARFRTPVIPLLALLAALGTRHLVTAVRARVDAGHRRGAPSRRRSRHPR